MPSDFEGYKVADAPDGPPWPVDFLADLHAGLYPDDPELLARVYTDVDARQVLDALERVSDILRQAGRPPWRT